MPEAPRSTNGGPLVSVVIPMYNAADYVEETIVALLTQTMPDLEVVVVDDGSTDGSADIVRKAGDDRVRIVPGARTGEGGARNRGMEESRGKFVVWNDADDVSLPHRLERMIAAMDQGVDYVHHDMFLIDWRGRPVGYQKGSQVAPDHILPHFLREGFPLNNNTTMLRRSAVGDLRHAEHFKIGVDSDFMRRFTQTHRGVHLSEGLLHYRKHLKSALATMARDDEYAQLERLLELEDLLVLVPDAAQSDWPDDARVVATAFVALCLFRRQFLDHGAAKAHEVLSTPMSPSATAVVRAMLDLAQAKPWEALETLNHVPANSLTLVLRGDALAGLGVLDKAAEVYCAAARLNPRSYDAITGLRAVGRGNGTCDLGQCRERLVASPERALQLLTGAAR